MKKLWVYYTDLITETLPDYLLSNIKQKIEQDNNVFFIVPPNNAATFPQKSFPSILSNIKNGSKFNDINPLNAEYLIEFLKDIFNTNIDLNRSLSDLDTYCNKLLDKTINQWRSECKLQTSPATWPVDIKEQVTLVLKAILSEYTCKELKTEINNLSELSFLPSIMLRLLNFVTGGRYFAQLWPQTTAKTPGSTDCCVLMNARKYTKLPNYALLARDCLNGRGLLYKCAVDSRANTIDEVPRGLFSNVAWIGANADYAMSTDDIEELAQLIMLNEQLIPAEYQCQLKYVKDLNIV